MRSACVRRSSARRRPADALGLYLRRAVLAPLQRAFASLRRGPARVEILTVPARPAQ
jgi:hypothetical protein